MRTKPLLAALAVALFAFVTSRPSRYRVVRSVAVDAPPATVRAQLVELQRWTSWSPWGPTGPAQGRLYGGPPSGVGNTWYWSTGEGGAGRLTVTVASADRIEIEIESKERQPPMADLEIALAPEGAGTRVTWAMAGELTPIDRILRRAVTRAEDELEAGLSGLKSFAEGQPLARPYSIERSVSVAGPPGPVLARLEDPRRWSAWLPWERPEAEMSRGYGGPPTGPGATYYWSSSRGDAKGRITILRSGVGPLELELELELPRRTTCDMRLEAVADGPGTRVTWTVTGEEDATSATAASVEKVMGTDLQEGLSRLQALVESEARARPRDIAKHRLSQR